MTRIYLVLFMFILSVVPSVAQAQGGDSEKIDDGKKMVISGDAVEGEVANENESTGSVSLPEDYEERLRLVRDMHEIWPIRSKAEQAIEMVSRRVAEANRPAFKAEMRKVINFEALEKASVDAMAEIYTTDELRAMIAFYSSKEGRSVSHKNADYEAALKPALTKMLDKGILDTKLGR